MEYMKQSDNELKVSNIETKEVEKTYTYEFLLEMKANLEAERLRVMTNIDEKLVEVNALIKEADKLGIKVKPEPIVVEPEEPIK